LVCLLYILYTIYYLLIEIAIPHLYFERDTLSPRNKQEQTCQPQRIVVVV
jgi:hypothetical protein